MKRVVCLQHVPFEGPAYFGTLLEARGYTVEPYLVPRDGLPRDAGNLLLVMGGPMSVNDAAPWIARETAFIEKHVRAGLPFLGICLGSQFLAKALGGRVYKGPAPEIGMTEITLTAVGRSNPALDNAPNPFKVFAWHGEGMELPPEGINLASSELYPVQAFCWGKRAYGLLFHLEMDATAADAICRGCSGEIPAGLTARDLVDGLRPHVPSLQLCAAQLIDTLTSGAPIQS